MKPLKARAENHTVETTPAASPARAREYDPAAGSEVAMLKRYLEAEFAEEAAPRRLPLAVSLPVIVLASGGLWAAIIAGVRLLAR